ncbi:MAG: hypothetical protein ACJAV1_003469 [Paraglaciecola sp.]|jgi:hypothetical protein
MFFEQWFKWTLLLWLFFSTFQVAAQSNKVIQLGLHAQPNKCVALNQGRECFAKMLVNWRLEQINDYCLSIKYLNRQVVTIKCWQQSIMGQLEYEFQSSSDAQLLLTRSSDNKMLASATIQVSWLYKVGARKRRWRLF